jgi:hypothetical protein
VIDVRTRLDAAGIERRVGGGQGVEALPGQQAREHHDLDLPLRPAYQLARTRSRDVHTLRSRIQPS